MIDLTTRPSIGRAPDEPPRRVKPIVVRLMRLDDIEHVSRIERRCYTLPWSTHAYATEVRNPSAYYSVATDMRGVVIGYAGMWTVMDEAHVTTIAVDPSQRGQKVGERLMLDLLDEGRARRKLRSTLEVRERNTAARNLYAKFGFTNAAIRRHYYSDNGENAIVMWANDLLSPDYGALLERIRRNIITLQQNQPS